jgi:hypothetical protein
MLSREFNCIAERDGFQMCLWVSSDLASCSLLHKDCGCLVHLSEPLGYIWLSAGHASLEREQREATGYTTDACWLLVLSWRWLVRHHDILRQCLFAEQQRPDYTENVL